MIDDRITVLVRGTGDVASAVAHALHHAGYAVALHEEGPPTTSRRAMAFADAVFDGTACLAGPTAERVDDPAQMSAVLGLADRVPDARAPCRRAASGRARRPRRCPDAEARRPGVAARMGAAHDRVGAELRRGRPRGRGDRDRPRGLPGCRPGARRPAAPGRRAAADPRARARSLRVRPGRRGLPDDAPHRRAGPGRRGHRYDRRPHWSRP